MRSEMSDRTTCLLVEDDDSVAAAYKMVLEDAGMLVCQAVGSEPEALDAILADRPDVALLDIDIHGGDSLGVATTLIAKDVAVAFVSGHAHADVPAPFSSLPFLQKPVSRKALLELVENLRNTPT
jgi:DNA-binding NtrC family response regulator